MDKDSQKESTLKQGNRFRDAAAELLRTRFPDVRTEVHIGHKDVDIAFTQHHLGKTLKIGVECKDYDRPLTKDFIAKNIVADYFPLVPAELNSVLIVVRQSPNSPAQAYVNGIEWLRLQTFAQLEEELLGIRPYLHKLSTIFEMDDVGRYYIDARFEGSDRSAIDVIRKWIDAEEGDSLAVLGGYGKGKTSLALRVVAEQAKRHLATPAERMPILLRLGQVTQETQLEAQFGKEFTALQHTEVFRFDTLMHLNRGGRLLIVLDGFDEMKHGMSPADFAHNFREFNRLRGPRTKVLLLGRPNALPSESRQLVLQGQRYIDSQVFNDPNFPPWNLEEIAFFSSEEVNSFLRAYLPQLVRDQDLIDAGFIDKRIDEIHEQISFDLLRRPVQARIVAELASDPSFDLKGFTTYTLYEQFIRQLVERDSQKRARNAIGTEDRLGFQRELAWWLWTRPDSQGHFDRNDIPRELLTGLPDGNTTSSEKKLNEYIVSTLTEEKEAGILYFAHRSFQEFLVAERLRKVKVSPDQHSLISKTLTPDILAFLEDAPGQLEVVETWFETLTSASGPLSFPYLQYYQSKKRIADVVGKNDNHAEFSAAEVTIIGLPIDGVKSLPLNLDHTLRHLALVIAKGKDLAAATAAYCLLQIYTMTRMGDDFSDRNKCVCWFLAGCFIRLLSNVSPMRKDDSFVVLNQSKLGPIEAMITQAFRKKRGIGLDDIYITVDIRACDDRLAGYLLNEARFLEARGEIPPSDAYVTIGTKSVGELLKNKERREEFEHILMPMKGTEFSVVTKKEKQSRLPRTESEL